MTAEYRPLVSDPSSTSWEEVAAEQARVESRDMRQCKLVCRACKAVLGEGPKHELANLGLAENHTLVCPKNERRLRPAKEFAEYQKCSDPHHRFAYHTTHDPLLIGMYAESLGRFAQFAALLNGEWTKCVQELEINGKTEPDPAGWVEVGSYELTTGRKIVSLHGETDHDERDMPRHSPPGAVGVVTSVDKRGDCRIYGVMFPEGTWVFIDEQELQQPGFYHILEA